MTNEEETTTCGAQAQKRVSKELDGYVMTLAGKYSLHLSRYCVKGLALLSRLQEVRGSSKAQTMPTRGTQFTKTQPQSHPPESSKEIWPSHGSRSPNEPASCKRIHCSWVW